MNERELLTEIVRIARHADGLTPALRQIQTLIAKEYGGALLMIRPPAPGAALASPAVHDFLEAKDFPFRGLYTAPLTTRRRDTATLVACIGTWGAPGEILRRIVTFAGEQLTELARRLSLHTLDYAEAR